MKRIIILSLIASISFPLMSFADEVSLPEVKKPAILNEGTQRSLSAAQIAELMPWAKDTKYFLVDLLDNIEPLSSDDKIEKLVSGIKDAVGESAPKNSELLMRYILNRALVINELILKEADLEAVGTKDVLIRTLISSVKMAITYYDTDMGNLSGAQNNSSFVAFGMDYFAFLTELNKSIFDASAQYLIERTALEWFQWDLYRDLNNKMYAPQIVKINNSLKTFSAKKMSDAQAIAAIRQMKKVAQQLDVVGTIKKMKYEKQRIENEKVQNLQRIEREKADSLIKIENDKKAELKRQEEAKLAADKLAEWDRLRSARSAIAEEQVKANLALLYNPSYSVRSNAINSLKEIPGGDVTIILVNKLIAGDAESFILNSAGTVLLNRVGEINYTLKSDVYKDVNETIVKMINDKYGMIKGYTERYNLVKVLGKISTVESYRALAECSKKESESWIQASITDYMNAIVKALK